MSEYSPCATFILPKIKLSLKGPHFESFKDIYLYQCNDSMEKASEKLFPVMIPGKPEKLKCVYRVRGRVP
jgi:hypothetical protein